MKKVFDFASILHNNNVLTVAYGIKPHNRIGIQVYPKLGSAPVESGKIVSHLRQFVDDLNLPVSKNDSSNALKDTGLMGRHIIKALKAKAAIKHKKMPVR